MTKNIFKDLSLRGKEKLIELLGKVLDSTSRLPREDHSLIWYGRSIVEKKWDCWIERNPENLSYLEQMDSLNLLSFRKGETVCPQEHPFYHKRNDLFRVWVTPKQKEALKKLLQDIRPVEDKIIYEVQRSEKGRSAKVLVNDKEIRSLRVNDTIDLTFKYLLNHQRQDVPLASLDSYINKQRSSQGSLKNTSYAKASSYVDKMGFNFDLRTIFFTKIKDEQDAGSLEFRATVTFAEAKGSKFKKLRYKCSKTKKIKYILPRNI